MYPAGGWRLDAVYALPDRLFQFHQYPVAFHPDSEQRVIDATLGLIGRLAADER